MLILKIGRRDNILSKSIVLITLYSLLKSSPVVYYKSHSWMKIQIDRPSLRMLSQTAAILSSLYMLAHWKMASCTLNNLQGTCKWTSKWNIKWQWWNGPHSWWRARWEWGCLDWATSRAPPALHWHASEGPNWLAGYRWKCNCFIKEIIFKYIINER